MRALALLPGVHLSLAGEGPERATLEALARELAPLVGADPSLAERAARLLGEHLGGDEDAARAIFENTDRVLLPGYFVRVRIPQGEPKASLLVPDAALGSDQGGRYLLVVNKDNVVEQRKVELGQQVDTLRVIESGITAEDRVIVGGLLRAIPGDKVDPQTQTASAAPAPPAPASGNAR